MKSWKMVAAAAASAFLLAGCGGGGGGAVSTTSGGGGTSSKVVFSGTVANSHITTKHGPGDPVAGATVVLVKASDVENSDSIQPVEDLANEAAKMGYPTKVTGADGKFQFTTADFNTSNPDTASYYTFVLPPGYSSDPTKDTSLYWPGSCASRQAVSYSGTPVDVGKAADDCDDAANQVQITFKNSPPKDLAGNNLPKATYVGSKTCLLCHGDKSGLESTLHFVGFRVPGQWNSLQDEAGLKKVYKNETFNGGLALFTSSGTHIKVCDGDTDYVGSNFTSDPTNPNNPAYLKCTDESKAVYAVLSKDANGNYWFQMANDSSFSALSDKYKVAFTYGGEGLYKQRYMMLVGKNGNGTTDGSTPVKHVQADGDAYYYAGPFQWNESHTSTDFPALFEKDGESWDQWTLAPVTSGAAIFTGDKAYSGASDIKATTEEQFATDCAGCHGGTSIKKDSKGNYITSYIDQVAPDVYAGNIGCEKCHGPGSNHVNNSGQGYYITYPQDLSQGRLTMLCGTCHQRKMDPASSGILDSSDDRAKFPAKGDLTQANGVINTFRPGMSPAQMYDMPNGSGISPNFGMDAVGSNPYFYPIDYTSDPHSWQDKQYGAAVNHSKGHHQQYFDLTKAGMWKNDHELVTCIDCHDAHGSDQHHQVVMDEDNNALCLSCHNNEDAMPEVFPDITQAMADSLADTGTPDPAIAKDVEAHMQQKAGMFGANYDPEGTGVGRCTLCHMPETAKSARWHKFRNPDGTFTGWQEGDIHSHAFDVMNPAAIYKMYQATGSKADVTPAGWTNSCGVCHNLPQ